MNLGDKVLWTYSDEIYKIVRIQKCNPGFSCQRRSSCDQRIVAIIVAIGEDSSKFALCAELAIEEGILILLKE